MRRRLAWAASSVLLVSGIALYLVSPTEWAWWTGSSALIPFALLVLERGERHGRRNSEDFGSSDGPWTAP